MARARKRSGATSQEGRYIASRIQDARRRGATNKEIATAYNINERTVRKIVAGETPGTKIYRERTTTTGKRGSPNVFTVDIQISEDEVRSKNVILPSRRKPNGDWLDPTVFDMFRFPDLEQVAVEEARAMQRR